MRTYDEFYDDYDYLPPELNDRHFFHGDLTADATHYYNAHRDQFLPPAGVTADVCDLARLALDIKVYRARGRPLPNRVRPANAVNLFISHPDMALSYRILNRRCLATTRPAGSSTTPPTNGAR